MNIPRLPAQQLDSDLRRHILSGTKDAYKTLFGYIDFCSMLANRVFQPGTIDAQNLARQWEHAVQDVNPQKSPDEDARRIRNVVWGLVIEGIFSPQQRLKASGSETVLEFFHLTPIGQRLIDEMDAHPLSSEFVSRLKNQAPKMTDDVAACLDNAAECLKHQIYRAGVLLVGVAGEITVRIAHDALVAKGSLTPLTPQPGKPPSAKSLLDRVINWIKDNWKKEDEERHRLTMALLFLNELRELRNSAAHPHQVNFSREDLEHGITSSAKQIVLIWRLVIGPVLDSGQLTLT